MSEEAHFLDPEHLVMELPPRLEIVRSLSKDQMKELIDPRTWGREAHETLRSFAKQWDAVTVFALERGEERVVGPAGTLKLRGMLLGIVEYVRGNRLVCDINELVIVGDGVIPRNETLEALVEDVQELREELGWAGVTTFIPHDNPDVDQMLEIFERRRFEHRFKDKGYRMLWPACANPQCIE